MSDLYTNLSFTINELITKRYSSSFSLSSTLFARPVRKHIYAIYGLVRIADEIVDTYRGDKARELLDELELDTLRALNIGYSANPVVHAYATTAQTFNIDAAYITDFFNSMRTDLVPFMNTQQAYADYIYGSAEVVGLMCLRVFTNGDTTAFSKLQDGARALGAAYQKINFLRDLAADANELERWYFPESSFETFTNDEKDAVTRDIRSDIENATTALRALPRSSRKAVGLSLEYYDRLLTKLERTSVGELKRKRLRVSTPIKLLLYVKVWVLA